MEWKTVKLGDIIEEISMGPFGSDVKKECYVSTGIPILNGSNLQGFKLCEDSFGYLTKEKADSLGKSNAHRGDIIVTHRGTLGQIVYIPSNSKYERYVISQSQFRFRLNERVAIPEYITYYFHTREGQHKLLSNASQVGVPALARATSTFKQLEISLPPLKDQKQIAAILSSLDAKIENNACINANLETQAQTLYKSWFIDFEPFGGSMPDNWKEGKLGEFCKCYLGGTPSRAKKEFWSGNIPWINSGEVNKYRILEGSEYITELGLNKSATKLLPKKTTVLAITGATLGQVSLLEIDACANQSVIGIVENDVLPYEYIYPMIQNDIKWLILHQTGGAQQHINKDNVESHEILVPSKEVMAEYKQLAAPIYEAIAANCFESQRLATLRDTLLPKLMKGEIEL